MKILILILTSLYLLVACSEVEFSPLPLVEQNTQQVIIPTIPPEEPSVVIGPPPVLEKLSDHFVQEDYEAKLDVLVVVDNSTSMEAEQTKLGSRMEKFTAQLKDIDWNLGITTTDVSKSSPHGIRGSLVKFKGTKNRSINKKTKDFKKLFLNTVQREETSDCDPADCPSSRERPLGASIMAMDKSNGDNKGFFRDEADLAIVILSDEDETESSWGGSKTKPSDVINKFKSKWPEKDLTAYAVVIQPGDSACLKSQETGEGVYANIITDFTEVTGGTTSSICDTDYGSGLKKIGENARRLLNFVHLSTLPNPESVTVYLNGRKELNFKVKEQRVIFDQAPAAGSLIDIYYDEAD
ncbi:MAG: hypothetical protein HOO06_07725 [Bdellovibrionaceae bacterium]|jgi:hypothetical protein|nr:hypothetical protein [Pseudobdellovibrionaceae bacterium]